MTRAHYVIRVDDEKIGNGMAASLAGVLGEYRDQLKQRAKWAGTYLRGCDIPFITSGTPDHLPSEIDVYVDFADDSQENIDHIADELWERIEKTGENWMEAFKLGFIRGGRQVHEYKNSYSERVRILEERADRLRGEYDEAFGAWEAESKKVIERDKKIEDQEGGIEKIKREKDEEVGKIKKEGDEEVGKIKKEGEEEVGKIRKESNDRVTQIQQERDAEVQKAKTLADNLQQEVDRKETVIQKKEGALRGQGAKITELEKEKAENEAKLREVDQLKSAFDDLYRDYRQLQKQSSAGANEAARLQKELEEKAKQLEEERKTREGYEGRAKTAESTLAEIINDPERAFREYLKGNAEALNSLYEIADEALSFFGSGKRFSEYLSIEGTVFSDHIRGIIKAFDKAPPELVQSISAETTAEDIGKEVERLMGSDEMKAMEEEAGQTRRIIDIIKNYSPQASDEAIKSACGIDKAAAAFIAHNTTIEKEEKKLNEIEEKKNGRISELKLIAEVAVDVEAEFVEANRLLRSLRERIPKGAEIRYFVRRIEDREDNYVVRVLMPLDTEKRSGALRAQLDEHMASPFMEIAGQSNGGVTVSDPIVEESLLGRDILFDKSKFDENSVRKLTEDAVEKMRKSKDEYDIYKFGIGIKAISVGIF